MGLSQRQEKVSVYRWVYQTWVKILKIGVRSPRPAIKLIITNAPEYEALNQ